MLQQFLQLKLVQWIREVWSRMIKTNDLKSALGVDVAANEIMISALNLWSAIYRNQAPWLSKDIKSLNLGAAIASEVARAVTIEMTAEITGSPRADFLASQFTPVLSSARVNTEFALAKGGMAMKPYVDGDKLSIDFVQADAMYPIAFDSNQNMTGAVFADQKVLNGAYYTRLETHLLTDAGYRITNVAYVSRTKDVLGSPVALNSVPDWADLAPEAVILNVDKPLFSYFKTPFANNLDPSSPLGVSIFSRAAQIGIQGKSLLRIADEMFSGFDWEVETAKRRIYIDKLAFDTDKDGKPVLPEAPMYRLVDMQSKVDGKGFFEDWTPEIRDDKYLNSIDAVKRTIEFLCGLSYGVISNPQSVSLTATEVKNSQQRYYSTVTDTQKSLRVAFDNLLYAMDVYTTLYGLAPSGTYTAMYSFDDSIVADHDTQFIQDTQMVSLGAMSKVELRMRTYGEDEETARKKIAMIQAEQSPIDFFSNANANVGA